MGADATEASGSPPW